MKNWKKILLGALAATALSATCAVYAACKVDSGIVNKFVVDETQTLEKTGEAGASVEFPEVYKEGYVFKGWYTNSDFIGMPVTSATYDTEVTYYARWAKGYEVKFDLDGGTLDLSSKIYLEENASIANAVQGYTPVYGDYQFGGWYVGDEPLAPNEKMTTAGITLTARYKAEYTVDVYLQSLTDVDQYVVSQSYATGYALIGDDYSPEVTVNGFSLTSHENEVTDKEISGTKSQNVFRLYFDRNEYTLTLSANYPDGTFDTLSSRYIYEKEFTLPENTFAAEGCRFVGWATSPNAEFADVIKEDKYALKGDEVLYAIWNVGLVDMFSGLDRIFVDPVDSNKIVLNRGGIDIDGSYDERHEVYTVQGGDGFKINVKLRDDGKFVYLSNRQGSYLLYTESGTLNTTLTLVFDEYDGCELNSDGASTYQLKGTYTVAENGEYTATLSNILTGEESTIYFKVGLAYNSSGLLIRVFKMRGEESSYGGVPLYRNDNFYYPIYTFDGYGSVVKELPGSQKSSFSYVINGDIVTVYSTVNSQTVVELIARFGNFNGQPYYEEYNSALDKEYRNADNSNITIKLNGSSTITYTDGDNGYTGTFASVVALTNGCRIIAVTEENGTFHTYFLNGVVFFEEENVAGVYYLYDDSGNLRTPLLVVKASDSATTDAVLYGIDTTNFWGVISRGQITEYNSSFTYVVDGEIAEWASDQYSEINLVLGGVSDGTNQYPIYFMLSAKEYAEGGEGTEITFSTLYVGEDGTKLTLTESFAVLEFAGETPTTLIGMYRDNKDYITVSTGSGTYYFILTKATEEGADNTFERLANAPVTMYQYMNGIGLLRGVTLVLTGRVVDGKEVAIYHTGGTTGDFVGYIETQRITALNTNVTVYKFVGTTEGGMDETFYFTLLSYQGSTAFNYYHSADEIVLGTFQCINDDGSINSNVTIRITADDKFTYIQGSSRTVGSWSVEEVAVFGVAPMIVYTFTPDDESSDVQAFKFTLRPASSVTYFIIESEIESKLYTAADGSTLELDCTTHVAQYTDKDGVQYENYYWTAENVLDESKAAFYMIIDGVESYFDIDGEAFTLRGMEQASYLTLKNNSLINIDFAFDGYGNAIATIYGATEEDNQTVEGTYTNNDGVYTVVLENGKTYTGLLGIYAVTVNGSYRYYNAFFVEIEGYEGSYLNEADLSVLVLDSVGNAIKYSSYGVAERGMYAVLDDGYIYYVSSSGITATVYSISGNKVTVENNTATYYADDFSSAVFTAAGNLIFGNGDRVLYVFAEDGSKFTTYVASDDDDANDFGFKATEYPLTNGAFTYGEKTYRYFNGLQITLTADDGSTLAFTPNGSTAFSVPATYTPAGGEAEESYVIVWYDTDGSINVTLSRSNTPLKINGSSEEFDFSYENLLTVNLGASSFEVREDDVNIGLVAYDYDYYVGNYANESMIVIFAEEKDGEMTFSVTGYFTLSSTYVVGVTKGTLSKAGEIYSSQNPYNTFICEFTGTDGYIYHLYFMLMSTGRGSYVFIPCPLVRVTGYVELDEEGSILYSERFIYAASLFDFSDFASDPASYPYPTLKYKGEVISATRWSFYLETEYKGQWRLTAYEYEGNVATQYLYVVDLEYNEDETLASSFVDKYVLKRYVTADNNYAVYAWTDVSDNSIFEIYALAQSTANAVTECIKNDDGSFTITVGTSSGIKLYYKVTFTTDGDETTVTVEQTQAPSQPGNEEVETPDPDDSQAD